MLKSEIEASIAYVKEQLSKVTEKLEEAIQSQKDYLSAAEALSKKAGEMKTGLETTLSTVDGKLSRVNQNSKFPSVYRAKVQELLVNADSNNAISATSGAAKTAASKSESLGEKIKDLKEKVESLENTIRSLLQQLMEAI